MLYNVREVLLKMWEGILTILYKKYTVYSKRRYKYKDTEGFLYTWGKVHYTSPKGREGILYKMGEDLV